VIGENQNHTNAAQAIERCQMFFAGFHRVLLKRTAYACVGACVDQSANRMMRHDGNSYQLAQSLSSSIRFCF
jgi:hypothetical protein